MLPAALELAHDIAENTAPMSVAASKRLLWDSFDLDRDAVGARETEIHLQSWVTTTPRKVCARHLAGPATEVDREPARDADRLGDLDAGGAHVLDGLGGRLGRDARGQVQQHPGGEARFHGIGGRRLHAVVGGDADDVDLVDAALPQPVGQRRAVLVGAFEAAVGRRVLALAENRLDGGRVELRVESPRPVCRPRNAAARTPRSRDWSEKCSPGSMWKSLVATTWA